MRLPRRSESASARSSSNSNNNSNFGNSNSSFGSEFARDARRQNAPASDTDRPVYGPKTAEEANFDPSLYAPGRFSPDAADGGGTDASASQQAAAAGRAGAGSEQRTAQEQINVPRTLGASSTSGPQWGRNGRGDSNGLGLPRGAASASSASAQNVPGSWTDQQIAALAAKFNLPASDPRLDDKAFVNTLYNRWREYVREQQAPSPSSDSAAQPPATGWMDTPAGLATDAFTTPRTTSSEQPAGGRQTVTGDGAAVATQGAGTDWRRDRGGRPPAATAPRTGSGPRPAKPLYDRYGNRVDRDGNVLDEHGNPVDAATEYEMTIGRKLREDMERLAQKQAELLRQAASETDSDTGVRIASTDRAASGRAGGAAPNEPPSPSNQNRTAAGATASTPASAPQVDRAGVGSTAEVIRRSNPYINVFLLCSLVANAFLFVWLHRLWHHHRDLIASTRMASSGMHGSDDEAAARR